MKSSTIKSEAQRLVQNLPDDANWDDLTAGKSRAEGKVSQELIK